MLKYLEDKAKELRISTFNADDWKFIFEKMPEQENDWDCGVFALMFADYLFDDLKISEVCQNNIEFFRYKIGLDLLRKKLLV